MGKGARGDAELRGPRIGFENAHHLANPVRGFRSTDGPVPFPQGASLILRFVSATARSRSGLLKGCAEVSLNLLSPSESVELLLRTGEVADADAGASAAAAEIAELCGYLPLYVRERLLLLPTVIVLPLSLISH